MTTEQILKAAIEKAEKNGYEGIVYGTFIPASDCLQYAIIFSHDFAKAFWGDSGRSCGVKSHFEEHIQPCRYKGLYISLWRFHLQQMVLEEDPIKYLEQFL